MTEISKDRLIDKYSIVIEFFLDDKAEGADNPLLPKNDLRFLSDVFLSNLDYYGNRTNTTKQLPHADSIRV